ncbi:hypothetical protein [Paenibacillus macquariensis]|nr:hypothetical protein [Paenibacillus macquariensis]MEC0091775.1 hypothetical protein [Paenibacillus macquariensis]
MEFAAEQSRLNNGQSIELDDFYKKLLVQVCKRVKHGTHING